MTACVNSYEDRFIGNIDRRMGARTGGSSGFVPNYAGATERNVWRRNDAAVEAPKATPAPRPVAPVVKKAAPVVAKAVEAEAPKSQFVVKIRDEMKEEVPTSRDIGDFTPMDLSRPKLGYVSRRDRIAAKDAAKREAQRREQEEKRRAAYRSSVVAAKVDKRAEMLARVDRLHWESCQALATQYVREGCHPNDIHWTVAALRSMVHQATDEGLRMIELCYLHQTERMSEKLFAREAERAAK